MSLPSGAIECTVDGEEEEIISVDFTDRELGDAEIIPELDVLPDNRAMALLLNGNDTLTAGAEKICDMLETEWNVDTPPLLPLLLLQSLPFSPRCICFAFLLLPLGRRRRTQER